MTLKSALERNCGPSYPLSPTEAKHLLENIDSLSPAELLYVEESLAEYETAVNRHAARTDFLAYCQYMDSDFMIGPQHIILAEHLAKFMSGEITRLAISMPPRMGKSRTCSQLFPSFYLGHHPNHHTIGTSNTTSLAEDNIGRKIRDLIISERYQELFPETKIRSDMSGAGRWMTTKNGEAYFVGTGAHLAGRGAHLCIIDDPHSESDLLGNAEATFENAWTWYQAGPRQRLMAGGKILLIHTRWSKRDLIGRVLEMAGKNDGDDWVYVELPAILPNGLSLWPEMFPIKTLLATKNSMAPWLWSSQYQQQPVGAESAIIKRESFKRWTSDEPPRCEYVIGSLDTAMEATTRSDFNALTVWGIFIPENQRNASEDKIIYQIILLDVIKKRMEYPELKRTTIEAYKDYRLDSLVIERKNSGASLIQDLATTGISVTSFRPGTTDKTARLNSVSDIIASGVVWIPDMYNWAEEFLDEVCGFPGEPHDDLVDSMTMALIRFREGGFIRLPDDYTVNYDDEPTETYIPENPYW